MKHLNCAIACVALLMAGCTLTPQQKAVAARIGGDVLEVIQKAVDVGIQVIVAKADSGQDLTAKGNLLNSGAVGLRTLEGKTNGVVTPDMVATVLRQFTDPTKTHWDAYADAMAAQYAASVQTKSQDQALEALAKAADITAASAVALAPKLAARL